MKICLYLYEKRGTREYNMGEYPSYLYDQQKTDVFRRTRDENIEVYRTLVVLLNTIVS